MTNKGRLRVALSETPSEYGMARLALPPILLRKAVSRMRFLFAAGMVLAGFLLAGQVVLQPEALTVLNQPLIRLAVLLFFVSSAAFLGLEKCGWLSEPRMLHLGNAIQVQVAFTVSLFECALLTGPDRVVVGVSLTAARIMMFGLLIPNTPLVNVAINLLSPLTWPAAYVVAYLLFGHEFIGWNRISIWLAPIIFCVVWNHLLNRRMYDLELQEERAEELGSYTLERRIGEGGMGEVWRARHRMLARDAAVKLIRPEVLSGQTMRQSSVARKRFKKEARVTASLRSPHTVALYDFGTAKDGTFYYAMELLDGIDLQTLVERFGPVEPGRVLNILLQVCESLAEAHGKGLVHRDIKPGNLFLSKLEPRCDFVKVLDFGLVKGGLAQEHRLESTGVTVAGTPAYMAPEVATGREEIDGRADLYALGCVAYFLLTGKTVFQKASLAAFALAHVQERPTPPSKRTELPVPIGLEQVILDCLAKDPDDRPQSAWDLATRLESLTDVPRFAREDAARWWEINLPVTDAGHLAPETRRSYEQTATLVEVVT